MHLYWSGTIGATWQLRGDVMGNCLIVIVGVKLAWCGVSCVYGLLYFIVGGYVFVFWLLLDMYNHTSS